MVEKDFIDSAIKKGFVTSDQVEACLLSRKEMVDAGGRDVPIWDLLVLNGLMTDVQVKQTREEQGEDKKSMPFGPFKIERKIGEGAMGVVYLARRSENAEPVAVKILPQRFAENPNYIRRFVREAKIAGTIKHENLVSGLGYGEVNRRWYYAMEFVEGLPLKQIIRKNGHLEEKRAIGIASQIAKALEAVEARGLVHRDVKPTNVIVAKDGHVKLLDLGLAKSTKGEFDQLTQGTKAMGTPHYMSPEQIQGKHSEIDIRTDIYGLGSTLYEMVTGQQPFKADTITEVMKKQLGAELENPREYRPELSDGICRIIEKAMAIDRKHRYQKPSHILSDLYLVLQNKDPAVQHLDAGLSMVRRRPDSATMAAVATSKTTTQPERVSSGKVPRVKLDRHWIWVGGGLGGLLLLALGLFILPDSGGTGIGPGIDHSINLRKAQEYLASEEWLQSIAAADRVLALDSTNPTALALKERAENGLDYRRLMAEGEGHAARSEWKEAARAYGEALKLRPRDKEAKRAAVESRRMARLDVSTWETVRTLEGHSDEVHDVAFSPSGNVLASGGGDTHIRLWDLDHTGPSRVLKGHQQGVLTLSFSPDGRHLASGGGGILVRVWDVKSGLDMVRFEAHRNSTAALAYNPSGTQIMTGSIDRGVGLWDATSGASRGSLTGHTHALTDVVFSPDGTRIATTSIDGTLRIWEERTGREELSITGHTGAVHSVDYSRDGSWVVTAGADKSVRIWDTANGRLRHTLHGHTDEVTCVAVHPDGRWIASGSVDRTLRIWNAENGIELAVLEGHTHGVTDLAFSASGVRLASSSRDRTVRIWGSAD